MQRDYQAVTTAAGVHQLVEELMNGPELISFDVESGYSTPEAVDKRALDVYHPDFFVVGFSITNDPSWARYIPLRHDSERPLDAHDTWEAFRPVLESKTVLAHHKKFEDRCLRTLYLHGDADSPILTKVGHDSMLAAYVSGRYQHSGLKYLTHEILGEDQTEFGSLFEADILAAGKKVTAAAIKRSRFNTLRVTPEVISYGCDDSALCLEIFRQILPLLTPEQRRIYQLEMGISTLMTEAEEFGVGVDWSGIRANHVLYERFKPLFLQHVRDGFSDMTADPETKELAAGVNFGSAPQVRKLLYEKLGMRTTRKTDGGELSTDAQALEALSRKHDAVKTLLESREIDNLGRRLKKWLVEYSEDSDARVHASFAQTRVVTGRFSAGDPAIQQLGKDWLWSLGKTEDGDPSTEGENGTDFWAGNFRKFIKAEDGCYLLTYDYSQVELRVLAGVTQEPALLRTFAEGQDPHIMTAAMMLGIPVDQVTKAQRAIGKTMNFAILYGMGPKSMAERLAISLDEAKDLEAKYKAQFTRISAWDESSRVQGLSNKQVHTWLGRTVPLWQAYSDNPGVVGQAERLAVNAQIQGGAADYCKLAMLRSRAVLQQAGLWGPGKVMLTMNQHDSLTFECSNDIDPNRLRKILQQAVVFDPKDMFPEMTVPAFPDFEVDWELGRTWGGAPTWPEDVEAHWDPEAQQWLVGDAEPESLPGEALAGIADGVESVSVPVLTIVPNDPEDDAQDVPEVEEEPTPDPEPVLLVTTDGISKQGLDRFIGMVKDRPGDHPIMLRIGADAVQLNLATSMTTEDAGSISLALQGATVELRAPRTLRAIPSLTLG